MSNIRREFNQDCRDKKITARSARYTRTHNGKAGHVRFPSDNLTKKEREALNGECKTYRMNDPMDYQSFKELPDDLKEIYLNNIITKYNTPLTVISQAMGVSHTALSQLIARIDLNVKSVRKSGNTKWDKEGFYNWWNGGETSNETEDVLIAENDTPEITMIEEVRAPVNADVEKMYADFKKSIAESSPVLLPYICDNPNHQIPVIPKSGSMSFENNHADDALATIKSLLSNIKVNITVTWECVND